MGGTYQTNGIVLARRDYRETDRLLTLYTEEYGKIDAIARGVKKSVSKLAGHLEPLSYASFMLAHGRRFDVVATSVKRSSFRLPHNDLVAFALASYFFEAVDKLTRPHQTDRALFALLVDFLSVLEDSPSAREEAPAFQRVLIMEYYVVRLLEQLGYRPLLDHCVVGGEPLTHGEAWMLLREGGLSCAEHREKRDGIALSAGAADVLRLMGDHDLNPLLLLERNGDVVRAVALAVNMFLQYHIGDTLNSESFLSSILDRIV